VTDSAADLVVEGRTLARYVWEPDLPLAFAPRPFLHPVKTPRGTTVTELMPASHRHHAGVSVAVPDVDGVNFWGGRTFIAGHGPAWLDNQGIQQHERWLDQRPDTLVQVLRWLSPAGDALLTEQRVLTARRATDTAWVLGVSFELTNATDRPVEVRSPAAAGRTGAGYGGFFWRAPGSNRVFSPAGVGLDAVHGQTCDWIAVIGGTDDVWTLVFIAVDDVTRADPWFVRTRDYTGVGSSLSWDTPLTLQPGDTVARAIATVVADGELSDSAIVELVGLTRSGR
jgi:methane monooxygenase PmoA-like